MTESFVFRLNSQTLDNGEVCGVVEVVATGERHVVTTLEDLREVLVQPELRSGAAAPPAPAPE